MPGAQDPIHLSYLLTAVRVACLALPEVVEEEAWVGTRWKVRGRTFAHVLAVQDGKPPAYSVAAGSKGPAVLLMFRSSGDDLEFLRRAGPPFFAPIWRDDEVGMIVGDDFDDGEIAEIVIDSYCARAPLALAVQVMRPPDPDPGEAS